MKSFHAFDASGGAQPKLGEDHYLVEAEVTVSKVGLDLRLNAA